MRNILTIIVVLFILSIMSLYIGILLTETLGNALIAIGLISGVLLLPVVVVMTVAMANGDIK